MSVTNVAVDKTDRFIGLANLFLGDVNTTPTSLSGIISRDPGIEVTPSEDEVEFLATHRSGPIAIDRTTDRIEIVANLSQFASATFGVYHGRDEVGQLVDVGGAPTIRKQFAARIQGTVASGANMQLDLFDCVIQPNGPVTFSPAGHSLLPIIIKGQENDANASMYRWTKGAGNTIVTIDGSAPGEIARVQGTPTSRQFHQVASNVDGSADVFATIVASVEALTDGETLTLQRANSDEVITVTNTASGTDTIDLQGTDDFVFANDRDTLVLQYNLSGTEWFEIERFVTGLTA